MGSYIENSSPVADKQRVSEQHLRTLLNTSPHVTILFDDNFRIIDCNPVAVELMEFATTEEMLSGFQERLAKSIPEFQANGQRSIPAEERFKTAATEGVSKFETEMILEGKTLDLSVELKRIPYENSFAIAAYVVDITEKKQIEETLKYTIDSLEHHQEMLETALAEAKTASKAKSDFLSTVSHEIRTPMNVILGLAEIQLQSDTLSKDVREAFDRIHTSGDMLLGIINDILDMSKIEAGKLELLIEDYDAASLISDAAQLNMMRIGSKPLEFVLTVDENMPAVMTGDALRVKQILNNLLSNAFKYTEKGTVKLSVKAEPGSSDSSVTFVFAVSDTGQGMTEEQLDRLFDEYSRFNNDANRTAEGTGLGMSIVKKLIQMMEGSISIDSHPGKGSTFTVRLPQGNPGDRVLGRELVESLQRFRTKSRAQMKRAQITREAMPYGSVLIVDDVESNIYVARGLLAPYELKIDSANSGFTAIEKIKKGAVYDIVFMDHMMPKMDGIEATKIIKSMGYEHPIVALTANAVVGQTDIFLSNGFADFIAKPIDIRQLNTVLNKLIRDKQPPEVIEKARAQAEAKKESVTVKKPHKRKVDPKFAGYFIKDARKSLAELESIMQKGGEYSDEDKQTYVVNIHGMKGALTYINEPELTALAEKLENAGRSGDTALMTAETPAFLDALRVIVKKFKPKEVKTGEKAAGNPAYLREKLQQIHNACGEYDQKTAKEALNELRKNAWPHPTEKLLDILAEQLLNGDFEDVARIAKEMART